MRASTTRCGFASACAVLITVFAGSAYARTSVDTTTAARLLIIVTRSLMATAESSSGARQIPPTIRNTYATFQATQHGPFDHRILDAATMHRLDPFLLKGVLTNESRLDPLRAGKRQYAHRDGERIVVSGGAVGIAQFTGPGMKAVDRMRKRRLGRYAAPFDRTTALIPEEAIFAAAELLSHFIRIYGRDGGVTAYNSGGVGGGAVRRLGFWRARSSGRLAQVGDVLIQGERFLLNVLRHTNRCRQQAGLAPLAEPDADRPISRAYAPYAMATQ